MLVVTGTRVTKNRNFGFNASSPVASGGLKVNAYEGPKTSTERGPPLRNVPRTTPIDTCSVWENVVNVIGRGRLDNTDYV